MKIRYQRLSELDACEEERALFLECFGTELELPVELEAQKELVEKLFMNCFDFQWSLEYLTNDKQFNAWKNKIEKDQSTFDEELRKARLAYSTRLLTATLPSLERVFWREYCTVKDPLVETLLKKKWLVLIQVLTNTLE